GSVGDKVPLASLQTSGQTGISGDLMRTHGDQTYGWLVGLGGDPTFDSGGGNIDFTGQIISKGANLTLGSGIGAGTTTFAESVSDLGRSVGAALNVQSAVTGLVWFKGTVTTYGQIIAAAGTNLEFDGNVTLAEGDGGTNLAGNTTLSNMTFSGYGGLTFNNLTLAGGPVTVTAPDNSNVTFTGTIDGAQNLTVNTTGVTTFGGAIGGVTPLAGLTTDAGGTTQINGGTVTTAGPQTYNNAVILGAGPVTISSGANPLTFNGPINGASDLVIGTTGVTTFNGPVGPSGPLASLSTGGSGSTVINGGSVMTTGAQVYNNNVTLGANTLLLSTGNAPIVFYGTLDGPYNLTANTGGTTVFNGAVGSVIPLASLSTWFGGTTTIRGSSICTTGAQLYQGDVATLAGKTTLMSTTNRPISFACVINPGGSGY